jgi:hypothetical protein
MGGEGLHGSIEAALSAPTQRPRQTRGLCVAAGGRRAGTKAASAHEVITP